MKTKTPKTIADLDINWTFDSKLENLESCSNTSLAKTNLFQSMNPSLTEIKMKQDCNLFYLSEKTQKLCATPLYNEPLAEYISYLNLRIFDQFPETTPFKLDYFERISDTEYIIHGK